MNDLTRQKLEDEICRSLDKLKQLDPGSEDYQRVSSKVGLLTELVNKDDEARNRYEIDREKLDAEANLEALKRGAESERAIQEQERFERETMRAYILTGFTGLVTLITFVGTWVSNAIAQNRSEHFEETGHAYTSRFSRFQVKEPAHPSTGIKK